MPHYLMLMQFTQQGVHTIKQSSERRADARRAIEAAGGKLHAVYYTMGRYDAVAVVEAEDDETASALSLGVASAGNVRTETLRAFTESEFSDIVDRLT